MPPNYYLFLDFQSPILGTTKYIVHFISQESRDYNFQIYKKPRISPCTLTEWLRATSGSEYSQMHTARFNLTYSLWVIGLTARCYMLVSFSIDLLRSITRLITNKQFWYVSYLENPFGHISFNILHNFLFFKRFQHFTNNYPVSLWRRANARNVRPYYPHWQYAYAAHYVYFNDISRLYTLTFRTSFPIASDNKLF